MSLHPHPTDQIGQLANASQPILDGIDQLIGTDERVPYFDDEVGRAIFISLPRSRVTACSVAAYSCAFAKAEKPLAILIAQLVFIA